MEFEFFENDGKLKENLTNTDITFCILENYYQYRTENEMSAKGYNFSMEINELTGILRTTVTYHSEQLKNPTIGLLECEKSKLHGAVLLRYNDNKTYNSDEYTITLLDKFTKCRKVDKRTLECETFYRDYYHDSA